MRFRAFRHGRGPFGFGRGFGPLAFRFGWWGPYGFAGRMGRPFARRRAYLRWLRRYKEGLEEGLRDVEDDLREMEREEAKAETGE